MSKRVSRNLHDQAIFVFQAIESLSVEVAPSSRLGQMHKLFVRLDGGPPPYVPADHPDFSVAIEGVRDLLQLGFIFDELTAAYVPDDMRQRAKKLVKDAALPQDDQATSHGRNQQFELYVAAMCAKAGLQPEFGEPDVLCRFNGEVIAIAVKRSKSLENIHKLIGGARDQIDKAGVLGVIVADLTMALNPANDPFIHTVPDDVYGATALSVGHRFFQKYIDRLFEWTKGSKVLGLIVSYHEIRQHAVNGWSLESSTVSSHLKPHNDGKRRKFKAFDAQLKRGLPTEPIAP